MKTNTTAPHELKMARHWDDNTPAIESPPSTTQRASIVVEKAASRAAAYVFNPAIVQQLWPPQQQLVGFAMAKSQQFTIPHNDAMFSPASSIVSGLSRSH
jgi:hypothetical protein